MKANVHSIPIGRWRATRTLGALACLAVAGCEGAPHGILVTVVSDLKVPDEIDRLLIRVYDGRGERVVDKVVDLAPPADPSTTLSATFGLRPGPHTEGPLTIEVVGKLHNHSLVAQKVRRPVPERGVLSAELTLSHRCLQKFCPQSETCLVGTCVDQQTHLPAVTASPSCDCNAYFPFCLGSRWTYDLYPDTTGPMSSSKSWFISDYHRLDDSSCGLKDVPAFLLIVDQGFDSSGKWLAVDQVNGKQRLWWLKEDWVDKDLSPWRTICYQPRKLRLDESRVDRGEVWSLPYLRDDFRPDGTRSGESQPHDDQWQVVTVEQMKTTLGQRMSRFPERYRDADVLCHYRNDASGALSERKYYCFARGVGKIYELDAGAIVQEVLRDDYSIPACTRP